MEVAMNRESCASSDSSFGSANLRCSEIWFAGDCHGVFTHILNAVHARRPDGIVFLGDLECSSPLQDELRDLPTGIEIAYIPGNHDTDCVKNWDHLTGSGYVNLHATVMSICGVRIAGLGGVFRKPWYPRGNASFDPSFSGDVYKSKVGKGNLFRGGLPLRHRSTIFPADVVHLSQLKADILVTHEAPGMHPCGFDVISELASSMGVANAYHGHLHEFLDYPASPWRGVGFRGIVSISGEIICGGQT